MSSEQQLERSVLERKERDELHAIATAMGVKATTRTKKADLVDRILEATGVATSNGDSADTKPKPAAKAEAPESNAPAATTTETADPPAEVSTNGAGPAASTAIATESAPASGGQQPNDRPRFDGGGGGGAEPGNRRSRRRRGRDRERGGGGGGTERGERDLAGHGQEQQYQGEPIPVSGMLDLTD